MYILYIINHVFAFVTINQETILSPACEKCTEKVNGEKSPEKRKRDRNRLKENFLLWQSLQTIAATTFTMLTLMSTFDYILRFEPEEVKADPDIRLTIEYLKFRSWIGQELMASIADVLGVIFLLFIRVTCCRE